MTSTWGVLVLLGLPAQTLRWGELKRSISGISEKMLIQTLQVLEADGLVDRVVPLVAWAQAQAGGRSRAVPA